MGKRCAVVARAVCRSTNLRLWLFSVSLFADRRLAARAGPGARGCRGVARARALSYVLSRRASATRAGDLGGGLLLALHMLSEYGLYALVRFDTFTTAIFDQFQSTFNGPAANTLAGTFALLFLALLLLESRTRSRGRYARLGSGSQESHGGKG